MPTAWSRKSSSTSRNKSRPSTQRSHLTPFAGYWPDGLYTAPTYEAMTHDIKTLKGLGHNMVRKHVKVEPALYYAAADELGILIMQDMPNISKKLGMPNATQQAEWERQLEVMVTQLRNYESIFAWVSSRHLCCHRHFTQIFSSGIVGQKLLTPGS